VRILRDPEVAGRLGRVLAVLSVIAVLTGFPLFIAGGGRLVGAWVLHNFVAVIVLAVPFWAIVRRQPTNLLVWALGWIMILFAAHTFVSGVYTYLVADLFGREAVRDGLLALPEALPTSLVVLRVITDTIPFPAVYLIFVALLLFPDGHLLSRRWRPVVGLLAVSLVTESVWVGMQSSRVAGLTANHRDVPLDWDGALGTALAGVAGVVAAVGVVLIITSLVLRYRRSSGVERAQIRWVAVGGGAFAASQLVWLGVDEPVLAYQVYWTLTLVTFPAAVASFAVAILRYRLYDIDVVIRRSLVVATLAGFIATVYIAVVVGVGRLVGVGDEASLGLKVVATAIVAVAFQPLRQRVRRWADRVVYGHRATPYEVLAGFSRAANAGDEENLQRIAEVLAAGTGAQPATVWLRVGEQVRPVASSAEGAGPDPVGVALDDGDLPELPASLVVDVRHDGELLGAVSLTKPRNEPPTRQDEELAARLARGLALLLRNARLTAELREHLAALQASRSRLVRAQDEARRAIEGHLRAGVQRQLAALEARLGDVRRDAAAAGAVRTSALLEQLEGEADAADDTLRALGRGIYPPLLEAEGLGVAVTAQAERATLPVTVHATGLPRYPAEVEVAVYFSILEALQNAAKYAEASSVHVRLEPRDDGLWFEVSDDGIGFDPHRIGHGSGLTGITARLDTIDGAIEIHSRPGTGTRITGHVPTPPHQPAPAHTAVAEVPA
jgi:two-component system, NarL family, sensor kinase